MKAKIILNDEEYEVELTEEQIKEIEKPKYKRWRAENEREYHFLSDAGYVATTMDRRDSIDYFRYSTGNYFKTKEVLEEKKKKLLYLQKYKDFIGEDLLTEKDFKNQNITKYFAYYDYINEDINIGDHQVMRVQGCIYSKSKQKIKDFIKAIGEDNFKKYVLEVDDEDK